MIPASLDWTDEWSVLLMHLQISDLDLLLSESMQTIVQALNG